MNFCQKHQMSVTAGEECALCKEDRLNKLQVGRVVHVTRISAYGNGYDGSSAKARKDRKGQNDQPQAH